MLAEAEKQNEEIKRLNEKTSENVNGMNTEVRNESNWLACQRKGKAI